MLSEREVSDGKAGPHLRRRDSGSEALRAAARGKAARRARVVHKKVLSGAYGGYPARAERKPRGNRFLRVGHDLLENGCLFRDGRDPDPGPLLDSGGEMLVMWTKLEPFVAQIRTA